jgi:hypothetical protein
MSAALDAEWLLEEAKQQTGLSDWGGDEFKRPFSTLVEAAERESNLSEIGRARLHQWLALRLNQRLRMIEDRKRQPEIGRQSIDRPIFLMGFPRAGTTYLHTLLSLDPNNVAPLFWQLNLPSPFPNDPSIDHKPAVQQIQDMLEFQGWLSPEIARMHFHAADLPEEDHHAFEYSFVSTGFMGFLNVPTYVREILSGDFAPAYAWHKLFLQALQVGAGARRWVLKAAEHTLHIDTLTRQYPDALLVQQHRDPSKVMASVFSLLSACRANYCAGGTCIGEDEARGFVRMYATGISHAAAMRDRAAFDRRFVDIHYLDLEHDPLASVQKVYEHTGLEFTQSTASRVSDWVNNNRKGKHGKHRYRLTDYGLTQAEVHEAFADYIDRFGVELEGDA